MCRSSLISKRSTGKNNISSWGRTQLSTSYHINVMVCDGEKEHIVLVLQTRYMCVFTALML